jgi:hypothetical protein
MKKFIHFTLSCMLLATLASCGNDNKSGKNNDPWSVMGTNPYTGQQTPQFGQYQVGQVINENPCISGNQQRIQAQTQLTNFPTVISPGDVYVGVTSFGDVGAIVGTGGAPTFIAYICPRSMSMSQGQLMGISIGAYSECSFKAISAATLRFPDGTEARFRDMKFGNSMGQKFSMCR